MRPRKLAILAFSALALFPISAPAQLAARKAQDWVTVLESPSRVAGQKVDEVLSRLQLHPGMVIADIGAGTGLFSRPMGKAVAPSGLVYAVDIQQDLLDYINQRDLKEHISDVKAVLGEFNDPKLPAHNVDLALINDVLHHIQNRAAYLKALAGYMNQSGRVAIIEMNKDDPNTPHRNQPELLISRQQIDSWMSAAGFHLAQEFPDLFPGTKWFLVYAKN
ncbi:MAG TPA: methyltransferase domain-containing protein [Bryobacteraceae bacterium]|nr:methyltransferase domain-containing protein [Bryobacteraceae bacterium]